MRIILFGYGEMGCTGLEFLLAQEETVAAVVTHRDDPKEKRWYRSLAERAAQGNVEVIIGDDVDARALELLMRRLRPDLILSFYYRAMLPMRALATAPRGALNLHGSLLPRLRGRAPTNWALVEGEERTGVTLHHMVEKPDAGDIVAQRGFEIGPRDTALGVFNRQVEETKRLLGEIWPRIRDGTAPRIPQDHAKATYRGRRTPEDGRIDWTLPSRKVDGLVRAVTHPWPGAFTFLGGRKIMVWAGLPVEGRGMPGTVLDDHGLVATGDGAYRIEECSLENSGAKPVLERGARLGG